MSRLPHLLLLLAAPALVACGSLYPTYDDREVAYVDGYDDGYAEAPVEYAPGQDVESVEVFYDELSEHGTWEQDEEHGYVFAPSSDEYVPYTDGYWVETEYGQTWVAEDEIGWAVAHYGHWVYRHRWLWVPGTVWGPAWVDWRIGGGYVGWAPIGYGGYTVPYYSWRYVPSHHLYARHLRPHYRRVHDIRAIHHRTRPVDRTIRGANGRRYIAGPAHSDVRATPRRARLSELPARATGRFAARDARRGEARRGDARRPTSYRASRARSERMSRAAPERRYGPAARTPARSQDRRYAPGATPTRRYAPPTRAQRAPEGASPRYRYEASEPTRRYRAPGTTPSRTRATPYTPRAQRPTAPTRARRAPVSPRTQRAPASPRTRRAPAAPRAQRGTAPSRVQRSTAPSRSRASTPSRSRSRATPRSSGPSRSPARSAPRGGRRGR